MDLKLSTALLATTAAIFAAKLFIAIWYTPYLYESAYHSRIATHKKNIEILTKLLGHAQGVPKPELAMKVLAGIRTRKFFAQKIHEAFVRPGNDYITVEDIQAELQEEDAQFFESCFALFDRYPQHDPSFDHVSIDDVERVFLDVWREEEGLEAGFRDLKPVIATLDSFLTTWIIYSGFSTFTIIKLEHHLELLAAVIGLVLGAFLWDGRALFEGMIYVCIMHPFDANDRVFIQGEIYLVEEIALLYTRFKKLDNTVMQMPNSLLSTLRIENHRRSGPIADTVELRVKYGTTREEIEGLRRKMVGWLQENRSDWQVKLLTEVRTIEEVKRVWVNFVFFHKVNYQNEQDRLVRRNKLMGELGHQMVQFGFEGPQSLSPGASLDWPLYVVQRQVMPGPPQRQAPPGPPREARETSISEMV